MLVKTNLKAGVDTLDLGSAAEDQALARPYINKWLTCYRCKGKKDQYGNVGNATCQMCWPMGTPPPV